MLLVVLVLVSAGMTLQGRGDEVGVVEKVKSEGEQTPEKSGKILTKQCGMNARETRMGLEGARNDVVNCKMQSRSVVHRSKQLPPRHWR